MREWAHYLPEYETQTLIYYQITNFFSKSPHQILILLSSYVSSSNVSKITLKIILDLSTLKYIMLIRSVEKTNEGIKIFNSHLQYLLE